MTAVAQPAAERPIRRLPGGFRRTLGRPAVVAGVALGGLFLVLCAIATGGDYSFLARLAFAGLGTGSVAALSGVGLALTYRATGVFNFAQGAIATFVAYVLWQLGSGWGLPLVVATPIALLVVGPALGVLAERVVFRPLQQRGASTSEKLVATLGIFVLLLGISATIWGFQTRTDAPALFPSTTFRPFGVVVSAETLGQLVLVGLASAALTALLRYTTLGVQIRAVVDKRSLAELSSIDVNRVAAIAWALGFGFAGLVGALYAPRGLNPYGLSLLVIETFAVAVIARLRDLPTAVVGGLLLGVVQSMSNVFLSSDAPGWLSLREPPLDSLPAKLLVLALPVFLLVYRSLDEIGDGGSARGLVTAVGRRRAARSGRAVGLAAFGAVLLVAPLLLPADRLPDAQRVLALTVVFTSIVAVTGFSGHITLGQAGFAGLGAFWTAKASNGEALLPLPGSLPDLGLPGPVPVLVAMLLAAALTVPVGIATGYPALRRKGLILGLATLAMGLVIFAVFNTPFFTQRGLEIRRPVLFGLDLDGARSFYYFELVFVVLSLLLAANLRSGRLGRILAAMRDSEQGATATGISLRKYKLFIFATSAAMASFGGSLLAQQSRSFSAQDYSPLVSLFYFTAVVVAGLSYLSGAVVAAALYVALDAVTGVEGASLLVIGVLALLIGRLPGGLVGSLLRRRVGGSGQRPRGRPVEPEATADLEPSPFARRVLTGPRA